MRFVPNTGDGLDKLSSSSLSSGQPPVPARKTNDNRMTGNHGGLPLRERILPQRKSIRLKGYDYSSAGAYFVTICTQNRECLFGEIVNDGMILNDAGRMITNIWHQIPDHYPGNGNDEFVVMPNHIHGIIIVGAGPRACPENGEIGQGQSHVIAPTPRIGQPQGVAPTGLSLPDIVHRFKTMTTKQYTDGVKQSGWLPFNGKLWQRNYYEHIVRDENAMNRIREYIWNNPMNWEIDNEYMGVENRAITGDCPYWDVK